jgi:hypothetical protein
MRRFVCKTCNEEFDLSSDGRFLGLTTYPTKCPKGHAMMGVITSPNAKIRWFFYAFLLVFAIYLGWKMLLSTLPAGSNVTAFVVYLLPISILALLWISIREWRVSIAKCLGEVLGTLCGCRDWRHGRLGFGTVTCFPFRCVADLHDCVELVVTRPNIRAIRCTVRSGSVDDARLRLLPDAMRTLYHPARNPTLWSASSTHAGNVLTSMR